MRDNEKSKEQLIAELKSLRAKVIKFEKEEIEQGSAKQTLQGSKQFSENLIRCMQDGLGVLDANGVIIDVNDAFLKMTGFSKEELVGSAAPFPYWPEEEHENIRKTFQKAMKGEFAQFELIFRRKNGERFPVIVSPAWLKDERGEVISLFATIKDITERKKAEQGLQESEKQLRLITDYTPAMISYVDSNQRYRFVNRRYEEWFNLTQAEIIGKSVKEVIGETAYKQVKNNIEMVFAGKQVSPIENTILKHGKKHRVLVTYVPDFNDQGQVNGFYSLVSDITASKQAEQTLIENEERMRAFASALPDLAFILDEDGRYVEILTSQQNLLYAEAAKIENNLIHEILPREKADLFLSLIHKALESSDVEALEYQLEVPKGSRSFEARVAPLQTRIAGKRAVVCVARDITERKEAELKLAKSEEKYRTLFEESKDVVYFSTPEGKFLDINPAGIELFGYDSKEEMLKIDISKDLYINSEDRKKLNKLMKQQGHIKDYEVELKRKDGKKISILKTATTEYDERGRVSGFRGILKDITQRKKLQLQLLQSQKMEAIGTLAGGIAHDFNNILAALIGYVELLRLDIGHQTMARANLEEVYSAAIRAKELVGQILTFSRKSKIELREIQIHSVVLAALRFLRSSLPTSVAIHADIDTKSGFVKADTTQIHQLIMNLCTNAFQAMSDGGGELKISLKKIDINNDGISNGINLPKGPYVKLIVSDTGHGMNTDIMKQIFDPYFTTKAIGDGTGMGLSVVHGIVKSHGGEITVYSRVGRGTTFTIYLPHLGKASKKKGDKMEKKPSKGSGHILLVDDERMIVTMGEKMLRSLGYQVTATTNVNDAIKIFKQTPEKFDLVITDLTMPKLSGAEFALEVQNIKAKTPIILMSGYGEAMPWKRANELNINAFLLKPFGSLELSKIIQSILHKKRNP